MQITFVKKDIQSALELSYSIVEKRNTIPILSNVKLEAANGALHITATDTSVLFKAQVNAQVQQDGVTTVPARTLYDIIRKLGDDEQVTINCSSNNAHSVKITLPGSNFSLPALSADEFPNMESNDNYNLFNINADVLCALLSKTRHAASNEEIRYYLNGIYMHSVVQEGNNKLIAVATDGHRLAKAEAYISEEIPQIPGVIIHKKAVNELLKLLNDAVGDITLGISENKIMFKSAQNVIIAKVIDGNFPDYNKAIPKNMDKSVVVSTASLVRAIDLVTSVSSDKTRAVKVSIEIGKLVISASSELDGNAKGMQEIAVDYNAEAISFGFNARYLLDALNAINAQNTRFSFTDHMAAVVLENPDAQDCVAILMPMQI